MKKILSLIITAAFISLVSCMKIDNWDAPDAQFYGNTHNYAVAKADAKGAVSAVVDHGISSVLSWAVGGVLGFSANVVTGALHSSYSEVVKKH